jgi:outer membrane protein TolC
MYAPKPLPQQLDVATSVSALRTTSHSRAAPRLTHLFDPSRGLDSESLAMLAVANNPELHVARASLGVAQAQVFSAGLLADPQLALSQADSMTLGVLNAWTMGLGFDVGDWLMHSSREHIAGAQLSQAQQQLLWQEWQVVAQARVLYVQLRTQTAVLPLLQNEQKFLAENYQAYQVALAAQNVTADAVNADWLALQSVNLQLNALTRDLRQSRADLNGLLGLSDTVQVTLVGEFVPQPIDAAHVRAQLLARVKKRPDMVALAAAYQAQEFNYHATVLAQFPLLSVGVTRSTDNFGDNSFGPDINLSVPIFNRNRGNMAVAKANREQVYQAYQARLDLAYREAVVALDNLPLIQQQLAQMGEGLPALRAQAKQAKAAYQADNFTAAQSAQAQITYLDKQIEIIKLQAILAGQQIALLTLLGPDV